MQNKNESLFLDKIIFLLNNFYLDFSFDLNESIFIFSFFHLYQ
jgi:hypothetical protein